MPRFTLSSLSLLGMLLAAGTAFAAPPQTATLAVENMTCGTCPIVVSTSANPFDEARAGGAGFDRT